MPCLTRYYMFLLENKIAYIWLNELQHYPQNQENKQRGYYTAQHDLQHRIIVYNHGAEYTSKRVRYRALGYHVVTLAVIKTYLQFMQHSSEHFSVGVL